MNEALRRRRRPIALAVWVAVFVAGNAAVLHEPWSVVAVILAACAALYVVSWMRARRRVA